MLFRLEGDLCFSDFVRKSRFDFTGLGRSEILYFRVVFGYVDVGG